MKKRVILVFGLLALCGVAGADDWPQWFGEGRDGIWRETGIVKELPEGGPKVLWRTPVRQGYAGPAVADGKVYVMDRKLGEGAAAPENSFKRGVIPGNERLVCLDAKSGKVLWEKEESVEYTVSYPAGPRTTPTVDGDLVFTLGAEGNLACRKTADGSQVWSVDFKEAFGIKTPVWGFAASPLVDGDLLICLAGGDGTTAVAF
ncbi:MAG: PQQ-binding-like beta-propeller repeat protein, partial [Verrucomicrobiales bacterium]|nr:PQQ-binding-like beta-propeller repeat protein [Verrucomicrobiales bacterium]